MCTFVLFGLASLLDLTFEAVAALINEMLYQAERVVRCAEVRRKRTHGNRWA